jgi:hypothetical protein
MVNEDKEGVNHVQKTFSTIEKQETRVLFSFVVSRSLLRPAHRVIGILDVERIDRELQGVKRIYHNR